MIKVSIQYVQLLTPHIIALGAQTTPTLTSQTLVSDSLYQHVCWHLNII